MSKKNRYNSEHLYLIAGILFIGLSILSIFTVSAQGDLMIFPKRLVFDENRKVQDINLANIGKDTSMYDVSFIQYRMNTFGGFDLIAEPDSGQRFASPYFRIFPRRVILAPNESQLLKVQLTKTNELLAGEYRSHLYFRSVINKKPLGEKNLKLVDTTAVSVSLIPVYGISIPCIIRKGESNASVSISDLEYEKTGDSISIVKVNFTRSGNMSTYGNISVFYIDSKNKSFEVGYIQGVALYTPGTVRQCKIELKKIKGVDYSDGKLKIAYFTEQGKKQLTFAEAELVLGH